MTLGPFGRAYEHSMRDGNRELYRQLQADGVLTEHLVEIDNAAQLEFESTFAALRRQHSAPSSFLERVQHLNALASYARELVLNDLLVRDDYTETAVNAALVPIWPTPL